jgi:AraC-like DNA-binding protein
MHDPRPQPHVIIPPTDLTGGLRSHQEGIGVNQPLAHEVMKPLVDLGLTIAVIRNQLDYTSNWEFIFNRHRFCVLLNGKLTYKCVDREYSLSPGEMIFCPINTITGYTCSGNAQYVYFDFNEHTIWETLKQRGVYVKNHDSADLIYLLVKKISAAYRNRSLSALQFAREDSRYLATIIKREALLAKKTSHKRITLAQEIVTAICQAPESNWTLSRLSKKAHLSSHTLNRIFIKYYGVTPMEMVVRERMIRASELLSASDEKVSTISRKMGYESLSSFSRLFKKYMGKTPGQSREATGL